MSDNIQGGSTNRVAETAKAGANLNGEAKLMLLYDRECPMCNHFACSLVGDGEPIEITNARKDSELLERARKENLDIDQGAIVLYNNTLYFGYEAFWLTAKMSQAQGFVGFVNQYLFRHKTIARIIYPLLVLVRRALLIVLGKSLINERGIIVEADNLRANIEAASRVRGGESNTHQLNKEESTAHKSTGLKQEKNGGFRMDNILASHMGSGFTRLSPLLQKVHTEKTRLTGSVKVTRGNRIAKLICWLFGFPAANDNAQLIVNCEHSAQLMIWKRNFDGLKMESSFRRQGEFLVEFLGPLAMSFKAIEKAGSLRYQFVKTKFWGILMPNFLSPQIEAYEQEFQGEYQFSVQVRMFLVGPVIAYRGNLEVVNL